MRTGSIPSGAIFDVAGKEKRLAELDRQAATPEFWTDRERAKVVQRERAEIQRLLESWHQLTRQLDDARVLLEFAREGDTESISELQRVVGHLREQLERVELERLLAGEHDSGNAILTIHPGAGGLEAQDWAEMLLRMYLRWAERHGFKTEILDLQPGEGAGIKSATVAVEGPYAYGYLKAEVGVHRLVRISPFDANARRHTSFASVFVYPDLDEDIEVKIDEKDLRIDTFRASGAGGQHVNKTDSAVRITHLPTGIVVTCQNERSQHKNKSMAMRILRARLYELELKKRQEQIAELAEGQREIAWGSQIRSYVLQPYRLVKDHRTGVEVGNADAVLDGDIDVFIEAYLRQQAQASAGQTGNR
ncbi:MAG: peptide chain release factor 2 [Candidatus Binatia bacterium]|nr:MAG: peptide chain release factor 2 [Candidatus Binatia bacterium]